MHGTVTEKIIILELIKKLADKYSDLEIQGNNFSNIRYISKKFPEKFDKFELMHILDSKPFLDVFFLDEETSTKIYLHKSYEFSFSKSRCGYVQEIIDYLQPLKISSTLILKILREIAGS